MHVQIKLKFSDKVLFEGEYESTKKALEKAVNEGADLKGAYLEGANLKGAHLKGADLKGANLEGAKNLDNTTMPDGLKWSVYLKEVVPALLTAGGKTLQQIIETGCWECHSWDNCPMAEAFGVHSIENVPPLYRQRADEFVWLFDAKLIPKPELPKKEIVA